MGIEKMATPGTRRDVVGALSSKGICLITGFCQGSRDCTAKEKKEKKEKKKKKKKKEKKEEKVSVPSP